MQKLTTAKINTNPEKNRYRKINRIFPAVMLGVIIAFPLSVIVTVAIGQVPVTIADSYTILANKIFGLYSIESIKMAHVSIIWDIRVPRVILAAFDGMGLALCGLIMQACVQNPLADPYILGTSTGASLGATAVIMLGMAGVTWIQSFGLSGAAFLGALLASGLVLVIASTGSRMTSVKLVLSGAIINMVFGSLTTIIITLFPNKDGMQTVTFWQLGSLVSARWNNIAIIPIVVVIVSIFFLTQTRILNVMLLGDETAATLGVNLTRYRTLYMFLSALLVGVIVSRCGIIGYVGLIIPHIARGLVGTDHRKLVPFSIFFGALFLIWADLVARAVASGTELPLGLITSIIGAPLLLYRVVRKDFREAARN